MENINNKFIEACKKGDSKLVEELLEKGANPNYIDIYGQSSFQLSMHHSNENIVSILIKGGLQFTDKSFGVTNPFPIEEGFRSALIANDLSLVRMVYNQGLDLGPDSKYGNLHLNHAICNNKDLSIVKFILEKGVDINKEHILGFSIIDETFKSAVDSGDYKYFRLMLENGAKLTPHIKKSFQNALLNRELAKSPEKKILITKVLHKIFGWIYNKLGYYGRGDIEIISKNLKPYQIKRKLYMNKIRFKSPSGKYCLLKQCFKKCFELINTKIINSKHLEILPLDLKEMFI